MKEGDTPVVIRGRTNEWKSKKCDIEVNDLEAGNYFIYTELDFS